MLRSPSIYRCAAATSLAFAAAGPAAAQSMGSNSVDEPPAAGSRRAPPFFGYTFSTGVLPPGKWAILSETSTRFDKGGDDYLAFREKIGLVRGVNESVSLGAAAAFQYLKIKDTPGLPERDGLVFEGLAANVKLRALDRAKSGICLAFELTPRWTPANPVSGVDQTSLLVETRIASDYAVVDDRLFFGANVKWTPATTRRDGGWVDSSALEIAFALTHAGRNYTLGGEMRRVSVHDGLALGTRLGHAIYVGPTYSIVVSPRIIVGGSFGVQVAGEPPSQPDRGIDLVAFERRQGLLRISFIL